VLHLGWRDGELIPENATATFQRVL
jgi:hypothetical protein